MTAAEFETGVNNILDNTPKRGVSGSQGITKAIFKSIIVVFKNFFATVEASNNALIAAGAALTNPFINYATNKGWMVQGNLDLIGFFGGNFVKIGNLGTTIFGSNSFGLPSINLKVVGSTGGSHGYSKLNSNLKTSASYISAFYFKKTTSNGNGYIMMSTTPSGVLNMNGTVNLDPYQLQASSTLVQNEWYLMLLIINANGITTTSGLSGVYRLSTGQKVTSLIDYRINVTSLVQYAVIFNETDVLASYEISSPFFAEITSDLGDLFYFLGINGTFPYQPSQITITPPVGTAMVYNLQRPYKFTFSIIYNDGLTVVSQPSATVAANTAANLSLTNTAVGKSITVQILQIP